MKTSIPKPFKGACPSLRLLCIALTLLNLVAVPASPAALRYQVLKSFGSVTNDGREPYPGLVEGSDGALYGVTSHGGAFTNEFGSGSGTAFKLNGDGSGYSILHQFGETPWDGVGPSGALLKATDGDLYGTTYFGGNGNGLIYKLGQDGSGYRPLASAIWPVGRLLEGSNGRLFGWGMWHLFKVNKDGTGFSTVPHNLNGSIDFPDSGLIEGSNGALYGTTQSSAGSNDDCDEWHGTIFKVSTGPWGLFGARVLHQFTICDPLGHTPGAGLLKGSDGRLYGTTGWGGGSDGSGTVFSLKEDGSEPIVLHQFGSIEYDGRGPLCTLIEGTDDALYGTTAGGGSNDVGTAFKLNKDGGDYSVLHHFDSRPQDGRYPYAGVIQGSDGAFYGTTSEGGEFGFGTVFKLWPPPRLLPPVVSNGVATLRIIDGPGLTNELQRATALDGSWQTLTNLIVPPSGVADFTDPAPPMPGAFYRTIGR